jgi:hypothetical protein
VVNGVEGLGEVQKDSRSFEVNSVIAAVVEYPGRKPY